jgi:copper chaperone CopZ
VTTPSTGPAEVRTTLRVTGMTCGNCVRHVQEALEELPGVRAGVDLGAAEAVVVHPERVGVQDLLDAVAEAGYDGVPVGSGTRAAAR